MINEDLTLFESMITDVSIYNNTHIRFVRQSGVVEFLLLPVVISSFLETDENNKSFIYNKPEVVSVTDVSLVLVPVEGTIYYNTTDMMTYIYIKSIDDFRVIFDNKDNVNSTIKVKKFVNGNKYYENDIVSYNGLYYRAIGIAERIPTDVHSNFKNIDETDLFKAICEDSAPKLNGYFDVSDTSYVETVIEASTRTELLQNFLLHSGDINNLELDMTVRSNTSLVLKYIHPDVSYRIKSVFLDIGFDLTTVGLYSYGSFLFNLGNQYYDISIDPTEPSTQSVLTTTSLTLDSRDKNNYVVNHLSEDRRQYEFYPLTPLQNSTLYIHFNPNISPTVPIRLYNIKIIFEKEI